jgi:hypothetical protein
MRATTASREMGIWRDTVENGAALQAPRTAGAGGFLGAGPVPSAGHELGSVPRALPAVNRDPSGVRYG